MTRDRKQRPPKRARGSGASVVAPGARNARASTHGQRRSAVDALSAPRTVGRSKRPAGPVLMEAEGTLSANRNGYGFVRTEALSDSVFIPPQAMQGLMHGDRVRIAIRGDAQGRYVGQVLGCLLYTSRCV